MLDEVETPALVVDCERLDANIRRLADQIAGVKGVALKPHFKTHKSVAVAQRQIAAGAAGITCQTVAEAEALVDGGVCEVVLSNEIVGRARCLRLARLARRARVTVCADNVVHADHLSTAAVAVGATLHVLVEIDVGGGRCGTRPGADAAVLARYISNKPGLRFVGLQAYNGRAQHYREPMARAEAVDRALTLVALTVAAIEAVGLACDVVAGAGTGSFANELSSGVYTELQCGSYVFMDADYARNATADPFAHALFVLTSVISVGRDGHAVCDAGLKALSTDSGLPLVYLRPDVVYRSASDEHGTLASRGDLVVGSRLMLVPGHCDPTVNMHDWLVAVRADRVEDVWPVARGR
jgi:D-serine deaminase-like pyridoxal phosphate-dependent protein